MTKNRDLRSELKDPSGGPLFPFENTVSAPRGSLLEYRSQSAKLTVGRAGPPLKHLFFLPSLPFLIDRK